jgi:membrane-associated phospholipid phosphatase
VRAAEWISVAFYVLLIAGSALARLSTRKRLCVLGLGSVGILIAWALRFLDVLPGGSLTRDLAPGLLLTIGYWQSGQFFSRANPRFQAWLRAIDERWFPWVLRMTSSLPRRRVLATCLDLAYLSFYPLIPLGIVILYLDGQRDAADQFWTVVLLPLYFCHACTILFPSLPPRLVEGDEAACTQSRTHALSAWLLRHGSITVNTFPSGHVASTFAVALVLLKLTPAAGIVCLWIAGSVTVATAVLRYHYSIDAVLGVALAALSFACFSA